MHSDLITLISVSAKLKLIMENLDVVEISLYTRRLLVSFRNGLHEELEYYPYDKYKSSHMETPTSNRVGGGYSGVVKTQSAKICLNFNFGGLWGGLSYLSEIPERGVLENLDTNLLCIQKPACASQIVSHTTYVETKSVYRTRKCSRLRTKFNAHKLWANYRKACILC